MEFIVRSTEQVVIALPHLGTLGHTNGVKTEIFYHISHSFQSSELQNQRFLLSHDVVYSDVKQRDTVHDYT